MSKVGSGGTDKVVQRLSRSPEPAGLACQDFDGALSKGHEAGAAPFHGAVVIYKLACMSDPCRPWT